VTVPEDEGELAAELHIVAFQPRIRCKDYSAGFASDRQAHSLSLVSLQLVALAPACTAALTFSRNTGQIIGPFRSLIVPELDDVELLGIERSGRRHPRAVLVCDELEIEPARRAIAGSDHGDRATAQGIPPAVEPEAVLLLLRPVAFIAVRLEQRLNVTAEIDRIVGAASPGKARLPERASAQSPSRSVP